MLHLVVDGEVVAAFGPEDEIRPEAAQVLPEDNVVAIPLAAGLLAPVGPSCRPRSGRS